MSLSPLFKKILFALIILAALVLGWPYGDGRSAYAYAELQRDLSVLKNLSVHNLPLLGPVSSLGGFNFPPAYYYLTYPFALALHFAPYSLAVASLCFFMATLALTFVIVKKWWQSNFLAFITMGLMATSILTIQLEKYGSNPNFIPFFALLFFYALQQLIEHPNNLFFSSLLAVAFAFTTQLHAVPLVTLPLLLVAMLATKKLRLNWKSGALFVAVTILIYSPYLLFEFTHGFSNAKQLLKITNGHLSLTMFLAHVIEYLGFWLAPWISINTFFNFAFLWGAKFYYLLICVSALVPIILHFNLRHRQKLLKLEKIITPVSVKTVICFWLLIPSLIILLPIGATNDYQIYYFFIFFPLAFMLPALALYNLFQRGLYWLSCYIILVFIIFQVIQIYLYHQFVMSSRI